VSATDDFIRFVEEATGRSGRRVGRETRLLCPGHDDHHPSLDVREGDRGQPLVQCRSQGCSFEQICRAIGREPGDFLPSVDREPGVVATYDYGDEQGMMLFQVVRKANKVFLQRRPDGRGGWIWNLHDTRRVPYKLSRVLAAAAAGEWVYVAEGEKDVEALEGAGVVATCNPGGAGKWRDAYSESLRGAAGVVIVADRDEAGIDHALVVADSLRLIVPNVRIVQAKVGKDVADHLRAGHTLDELEPTGARRDPRDLSDLKVDDILAANPEITKDELLADNPSLKALLGGKANVASEIVHLVEEAEVLLFRDLEGRGFATYECGSHFETYAIRSRTFRLFVRKLYFDEKESSPSANAVSDALGTIEAKAIFDGPERSVHLRVGGESGAIYIDLGDPQWTAIKITASGWEVVDKHPLVFRRAPGMAALPVPVEDGCLSELHTFLNTASEDDYRLLIGWLLAAARPAGQPYPLLVLHGEQGSAKSTTSRILRDLLDPNTVPLRAAPRDLRDLMISANSSWIISFDNLSHLQPWLSDGLCRLSTGGGFATRELYTDDAELVLEAQRPVILNGIEELATRGDLLDRAVLVHLPTIQTQERRAESDFWLGYYQTRPRMLGAFCAALVTALANVESTTLERPPRMADFAIWATAAEDHLGWPGGAFERAYSRNRSQGHALAVEASIVGPVLLAIADKGYEGTAAELLQVLVSSADEKIVRQREWPKSPRALSGIVKRLAPNLRALGYEVTQGHREATSTRRRLITIRRKS
jgi:hypothetical protein